MNLNFLVMKIRKRLHMIMLRNKYKGKLIYSGGFPNISLSAQISISNGSITLGTDVSVWRDTLLAASGGNMVIGCNVLFNNNCNVVCKEKITIGDETLFGPNVCVFDHNHKFDMEGVKNEYSTGAIHIGKKCWIGAGSIILKGTTIGNGCIIGAGSIVKGDIPAHSIVTSQRGLTITAIHQ